MNWALLLPEWLFLTSIIVGLGSCVRPAIMRQVCWWSLVMACVLSIIGLSVFDFSAQLTQLFFMNGLIAHYKIFFVAMLLLIILFTRQSWFSEDISDVALILLGLSSLGMLAILSASHLLTLYIGIELMSLPLYALMAMEREDDKSLEASLKYFVTGAIASGFLLFGFAFIYATTGHMNLESIATAYQSGQLSGLFSADMAQLMTGLGIAFIMAAFAFKMGLFPFHSYLPDVYEGVRLDVLLVFATVVKFAIAVAFLKVVSSLQLALPYWQPIIAMTGLASLAYGNVMALKQTNVRRLLAYSSIAHMGFFVMCCYAFGDASASSGMLYMAIYTLMSFVVLGILFFIRDEKQLTVADLSGLAKQHAALSVILMVTFFSLAGIPPLAGFLPKFLIIRDLVQGQYTLIAVAMILLTVIALGYYLAVIRNLYFGDLEQGNVVVQSRAASSKGILVGLAILIFMLGVYPTGLINYLQVANVKLLFMAA